MLFGIDVRSRVFRFCRLLFFYMLVIVGEMEGNVEMRVFIILKVIVSVLEVWVLGCVVVIFFGFVGGVVLGFSLLLSIGVKLGLLCGVFIRFFYCLCG